MFTRPSRASPPRCTIPIAWFHRTFRSGVVFCVCVFRNYVCITLKEVPGTTYRAHLTNSLFRSREHTKTTRPSTANAFSTFFGAKLKNKTKNWGTEKGQHNNRGKEKNLGRHERRAALNSAKRKHYSTEPFYEEMASLSISHRSPTHANDWNIRITCNKISEGMKRRSGSARYSMNYRCEKYFNVKFPAINSLHASYVIITGNKKRIKRWNWFAVLRAQVEPASGDRCGLTWTAIVLSSKLTCPDITADPVRITLSRFAPLLLQCKAVQSPIRWATTWRAMSQCDR